MSRDTFADFTPAEREEIAAAIGFFIYDQKRGGWTGTPEEIEAFEEWLWHAPQTKLHPIYFGRRGPRNERPN